MMRSFIAPLPADLFASSTTSHVAVALTQSLLYRIPAMSGVS